MVTIEKMFGVQHGARIVTSWGEEYQCDISPSQYLTMGLMKLPKGSRVGIEFCPELASPVTVNGRSIDIEESTKSYWRDVENLCHTFHLNIVYLDDLDLYKKVVVQELHAHRLREKLGMHKTEEDFWTLRRALYKTSIKSRMIQEIKRERSIFKKILTSVPDIVILGKAHGDLLMTNKRIRKRIGIIVKDYMTEEMSQDFPSTVFPAQPSREFIVERRQLIRKYRVIKKGRILLNKKPSYIGIFQASSFYTPEEGLFEIYQTSPREFSGIIADTFGDADFTGEISNDQVKFTKKYIANRSLPNAAESELYYEGKTNGQHLKGTWRMPGARGNFLMVPFSDEMDTKALLNSSIEALRS